MRQTSLYNHIICNTHIKIQRLFKLFVGYVHRFRRVTQKIFIHDLISGGRPRTARWWTGIRVRGLKMPHWRSFSWWRHQMETISALSVTGEFPAQRPVTRSFDVFLDLRLNGRLSKQSWGWWFETPSRTLWRHSNALGLSGELPPGWDSGGIRCWRHQRSDWFILRLWKWGCAAMRKRENIVSWLTMIQRQNTMHIYIQENEVCCSYRLTGNIANIDITYFILSRHIDYMIYYLWFSSWTNKIFKIGLWTIAYLWVTIPLVKASVLVTVLGIRQGPDDKETRQNSWAFVPKLMTISVCTSERCPPSQSPCFRILSCVNSGLECRGYHWCDLDGGVHGRSVWVQIRQNAYGVAHTSYGV